MTRVPSDIEKELLLSQRELQECAQVTVERSVVGDLGEVFEDPPAVFGYLPEWNGVRLGRDLCVNSPRISELAVLWHTGSSVGELHGEFRITDLFVALLKRAPEFSWQGVTQEEIDFHSELRVVDDTPVTALGHRSFIRKQRDVDPLEMWFYDMDLNRAHGWDTQFVRMDLTYVEYVRHLAVTKGVLGWQYLFVDGVRLSEPDFSAVATRLKTMLEVFPVLFPRHDYTVLRQRLEARL
jgi:hypothetical protein